MGSLDSTVSRDEYNFLIAQFVYKTHSAEIYLNNHPANLNGEIYFTLFCLSAEGNISQKYELITVLGLQIIFDP